MQVVLKLDDYGDSKVNFDFKSFLEIYHWLVCIELRQVLVHRKERSKCEEGLRRPLWRELLQGGDDGDNDDFLPDIGHIAGGATVTTEHEMYMMYKS